MVNAQNCASKAELCNGTVNSIFSWGCVVVFHAAIYQFSVEKACGMVVFYGCDKSLVNSQK